MTKVESSVRHCPTCGRKLDKTNSQRNLFHKLYRIIGAEQGETPGHVKYAIKSDFYGVDEYKIGTRWYRGVRSTESSERDEYSALIDFTYIWAAQNLGMTLAGKEQ